MSKKIYKIVLLLVTISVMNSWYSCHAEEVRKPLKGKYLYDYAHILKEVEEYSNQYLQGILKRYSIEAVIMSLPTLEGERNIEELAVKLFSDFKIGQSFGGRGILVLLVEKEKQAKLEVSYELEDVFTDGFCGYIEDLQLKPYFLGDQLGIGLLAVMEELEKRAQIKYQANYTPDYIAKLDRDLLSGGA